MNGIVLRREDCVVPALCVMRRDSDGSTWHEADVESTGATSSRTGILILCKKHGVVVAIGAMGTDAQLAPSLEWRVRATCKRSNAKPSRALRRRLDAERAE